MKIKNLHELVIMALMICPLFISNGLKAQTDGALTCSFTTTFTGGTWGTKYCLAAWIETSSGTFIKTKFKYSKSSNLDHLATWTGVSASNVVDATTGTTLAAPGLLTFTWNGTDAAASALVADGTYKVWVELAWGSSLTTGKAVQSFSFTKGVTADHQTGTSTNVTGVTMDWVPSFVGVAENTTKPAFTVAPNPVNNESTISYSLTELSDVTISVIDINGKVVSVLLDENQGAGNYTLPLSQNGKLTPGVYFVKMYTGKTQHTERILVSE